MGHYALLELVVKSIGKANQLLLSIFDFASFQFFSSFSIG